MEDKTQTRLISLIENRKDKIVSFVQELIRIPSLNTPPTGQEKKCQLFIADKLKNLGMEVDIFSPDELVGLKEHPYYNPGREYRDRPNVVGTYKGKGKGKSILLTGHVDVVSPGDKKQWKHDPWGGIVEAGRIFGRGTTDMKGGLGAEIMAIECVKELGIHLQGDIIFASVVDEEFGGMNGSLACAARGYRADGGILAEPTSLMFFPGSAGGQQYRIKVKGKIAFEGEKHKGVSAIEKMYKVIHSLQELERKRDRRAKKHPLFSNYPIASPIAVISIQGGDPEIGGIPDWCTIEVWHGAIPGETEDEVIDELHQWLRQSLADDSWLKVNPVEIKPIIKWIDPCDIPIEHPVIKTASSAFYKVTGERPKFAGMRGASDLSRFIICGETPMFIFGPGDSGMAHCLDESLSIENLIKATKVIALTILDWCK